MASYSSVLTIDVANLRKFGTNLRRSRPDIYKAMRVGLTEAGELVAAEARVIAAGSSSRVAETIRVKVSSVNVRVVAGMGEEAPHAGEASAFEHKGVPGTFRHPVFGHRDRWAGQQAHPFLAPALEHKADAVAVKVGDAIDAAMTRFFGGL